MIDKVPNAIKGRDNIEIEIYGMEGIPEEDLRAHEKRLAGKNKEETESTDTSKVPPSLNMPPLGGIMPAAPMMPLNFPAMPFGVTPVPMPMIPPVPMITPVRPSTSLPLPIPTNSTANLISAAPTKPLFPSGATNVHCLTKV